MDYRAYFLDDDGRVFAREDIIAENDEEAVRAASQLQNDRQTKAF